MPATCHFFARGNGRNGTACRFSHISVDSDGPSKPNLPCKFYQQGFLRRLNGSNDIDAQLCAIYSVRDKLGEYVSELGPKFGPSIWTPNELALTVGLLEPLKDAFDNEKFTEVLRALSANLIVATSAGYVDEINSEARFMEYLGLSVQICRVHPRCMRLVPMVSVKARAAQVIKKHDHQARIYIQQIEFYLAGGSGSKAHQRGRSANRVHLTEAESEECEVLMREENLLPTLDEIRDRHSGSTLRPKLYVDGLIDHERVKKYDRVGGVATDVYFLDHRQPEQSSEGSSKRNEFEASYAYVVRGTYLFRSQQYKPSDVTLLTPYVGQKRLIRSLLGPDLRSSTSCSQGDARVVTIDEYQGEENKVTILSLVRSNGNGKIGFIGIENRVIVALSRARKGLYIIGNVEMIEKAPSWAKLKCRTHPDNIEGIATPEAFHNVKDGGSVNLARSCFPVVVIGALYCVMLLTTAGVPVELELICGHKKQVPCHMQDGPSARVCLTPVVIALPCGHEKDVACHAKKGPESFLCEEPVGVVLACGHKVTVPCREKKVPPTCAETDSVRPCGHKKDISCVQKDVSFYRRCVHAASVWS
ncbi:hypothetical protein FOZ62_002321 [Perkinsus olseni]|uniref:C3H1-type domain-containing protein n=1 Tax=Perkinsus olseni TaxID=32597 RepID=A0A7J6SXQ1_PEROL|nr:hypothetical protein FOZ62_002321 [Perkinsus olseni]